MCIRDRYHPFISLINQINFRKTYRNQFSRILLPFFTYLQSSDYIFRIRALADGYELPVSTSWVHIDYPDIVFADLGPNPVLPDSTDYVLKVEMED